MDLHNNEVGFEIGETARENGWSEEQIEQEVLKALDEVRLIVIELICQAPQFGLFLLYVFENYGNIKLLNELLK